MPLILDKTPEIDLVEEPQLDIKFHLNPAPFNLTKKKMK